MLEVADLHAIVRRPDVGLLLQKHGLEDGRAFREMIQRILVQGGLVASTLGDPKTAPSRGLCLHLQEPAVREAVVAQRPHTSRSPRE